MWKTFKLNKIFVWLLHLKEVSVTRLRILIHIGSAMSDTDAALSSWSRGGDKRKRALSLCRSVLSFFHFSFCRQAHFRFCHQTPHILKGKKKVEKFISSEKFNSFNMRVWNFSFKFAHNNLFTLSTFERRVFK